MSLLIVNVAEREKHRVQRAIELLTRITPEHRVIDATKLDIRSCSGCYVCMLNTPGICAIKDDYHILIEAYVQADDIVFLVDTALDFVDHKAKNIIDRLFSMGSILMHDTTGKIRHIPRYSNHFRIGVMYTGSADPDHMQLWTGLVADNMSGISLGAHSLEQVEEVYKWIFL